MSEATSIGRGVNRRDFPSSFRRKLEERGTVSRHGDSLARYELSDGSAIVVNDNLWADDGRWSFGVHRDKLSEIRYRYHPPENFDCPIEFMSVIGGDCYKYGLLPDDASSEYPSEEALSEPKRASSSTSVPHPKKDDKEKDQEDFVEEFVNELALGLGKFTLAVFAIVFVLMYLVGEETTLRFIFAIWELALAF